MLTNQELVKLWANDAKRRAFVNDYKKWGKWFSQSELDLTFYKYELPGGGRIIAMEYLREPFRGEYPAGYNKPIVGHKFYLQKGKYFSPSAASEHEIAGRLMELKALLAKGLHPKEASA